MARKFLSIFQKGMTTEVENTTPALDDRTFLIAGLGNPGRQYKTSRHNVGFLVLDRIASRLGASFSRLESRALVTRAEYEGLRLILAKPQTYMNLSGVAVGALVRFYKVPLEHMLVIYDDVDLPMGSLRLRPSGGSAGQKGMASIIERFGTQDIPRLRVGIGRPPGSKAAAGYVLQEFNRAEMGELDQILDRAADAALMAVTQGLAVAMNKHNS